jgi:DNA-binding MarR family transcriptional regulator
MPNNTFFTTRSSNENPDRPAGVMRLIGEIARQTGNLLRAEGERIGHRYGYRSLLYQLTHGADGASQQELVKRTGLSAPTVSVAISRMESDGLVMRRFDPDDLRSVRVHLTDKGWALHESMKSILDRLEQFTIKGFSQDEIRQFEGYLLRVYDNIQSEEPVFENI